MAKELAKYRGYLEYANSFLSWLHRKPAEFLYWACGWSKYTTAEAYTLIGGASLVAYATCAALFIMGGPSKGIDSLEDLVIAGSATVHSTLQSWGFYKNFDQGEVAKLRAEFLHNHNLPEVVAFEEQLERDRQIRHAGWYALQVFSWWGILKGFSLLGSIDMTDPLIKGMYRFAMIGTIMNYGAKYVLASPVGSPSLDIKKKPEAKK